MNVQPKVAVSVAEMARAVGLSRSRFYQLIGSAFPAPSRDQAGRPFFDEEQQRVIQEVRHRNCGINGKPILFYPPRHTVPTARRTLKPKMTNNHTDIIEGVRALGLSSATAAQVDAAIHQSFPNGTAGVDPGEVIRVTFLSIRCKNSSDNVGR